MRLAFGACAFVLRCGRRAGSGSSGARPAADRAKSEHRRLFCQDPSPGRYPSDHIGLHRQVVDHRHLVQECDHGPARRRGLPWRTASGPLPIAVSARPRSMGLRTAATRFYAVPQEADLIWTPRFTNSLSASVSAAYQRHQEHKADLLEAFVSFLPPQKGPVGFSMRAGIMWPEISLEHTTGGAWSTVNTLTPSAINAWVGEEVKVLGVEGTVRASIGNTMLAFTGSVFGFDDTAGTLLSFRGWALHNEKATVFGHFPLPPLNPFITAIAGRSNTVVRRTRPSARLLRPA